MRFFFLQLTFSSCILVGAAGLLSSSDPKGMNGTTAAIFLMGGFIGLAVCNGFSQIAEILAPGTAEPDSIFERIKKKANASGEPVFEDAPQSEKLPPASHRRTPPDRN